MHTFNERVLLRRAEELKTIYDLRYGRQAYKQKVFYAAQRSWERSTDLAEVMQYNHYNVLARRAKQTMDEAATELNMYVQESDEYDAEAGAFISDNLDAYRQVAAKMARHAGVEIHLESGE